MLDFHLVERLQQNDAHLLVLDLTQTHLEQSDILALLKALHTNTHLKRILWGITPSDSKTYIQQINESISAHQPQDTTSFKSWQTLLANSPERLQLPIAKTVSLPTSSLQKITLTHTLSALHWQQLKTLAAHNEVSLLALLLTAYQTLLYRYTGEQEAVIGTLDKQQVLPVGVSCQGHDTVETLLQAVNGSLTQTLLQPPGLTH